MDCAIASCRRNLDDTAPSFNFLDIAYNQTAGTAPSGAHTQPWHFVIVRDPAVKKKLRALIEVRACAVAAALGVGHGSTHTCTHTHTHTHAHARIAHACPYHKDNAFFCCLCTSPLSPFKHRHQEEEEVNYRRRMGDKWVQDLTPLQTDWHKPYIEDGTVVCLCVSVFFHLPVHFKLLVALVPLGRGGSCAFVSFAAAAGLCLFAAPASIVVLRSPYSYDESGEKQVHYYHELSTGIACGLLGTQCVACGAWCWGTHWRSTRACLFRSRTHAPHTRTIDTHTHTHTHTHAPRTPRTHTNGVSSLQ